MINGLQLFQECLQHPEELVDEFYCTDELIISADANKDPTPIMQTWLEVQKRITAADVALKDSDQKTYHRCVEKLDEVLRNNEYTNFLEFTSFFPAMDVSFSIYKKLRCAKRIEFLNKILRTYIKKRHPIYNSHGYSPNIIQVRKDFEKHKSSGSFFKNKMSHMAKSSQYREAAIQSDGKTFCFVDDPLGQQSLQWLQDNGADWYGEWSNNHERKKADVLFRNRDGYFICEAKHMKEGGGGQDKQINELITFIEKRDAGNIFYVAFLDRMYFEKFQSPSPRAQKILKQKSRIESGLKKGNYFINTYGLQRLLQAV